MIFSISALPFTHNAMSVPQRRHKQSTKNAAFALFNQIKKALDLKVQDGNIRGTTRFTVKQSLCGHALAMLSVAQHTAHLLNTLYNFKIYY